MGEGSLIHNIVMLMLRRMVRRWRKRSRSSSSSAPPAAKAPAGHSPVYLGSRWRRFNLRAAHINHPTFQKLLLAEEECCSPKQGPLFLPCEEAVFLQVLSQISPSYAARFAVGDDFDWQTGGCCSY